MDKDLFLQIQNVVVEVLRCPPEQIELSSHFKDDLGADSIDIVSLLMALEDNFERTIPNEVAETFVTVGDVYNYIQKHS